MLVAGATADIQQSRKEVKCSCRAERMCQRRRAGPIPATNSGRCENGKRPAGTARRTRGRAPAKEACNEY